MTPPDTAQFIRAPPLFAQVENPGYPLCQRQHISNKRLTVQLSVPVPSPLLSSPPLFLTFTSFLFSHPFLVPLLYFRLSLLFLPPSCTALFFLHLRCLYSPPHPPLSHSPPSFHFGFSNSGNEMFHYLHFTAFNRERIQAKPRVVSQGVTMGDIAGLGAQRERQPRNYTHIQTHMHNCKEGRHRKRTNRDRQG